MTQVLIKNLPELQAFAAKIAQTTTGVVCLSGDLGAGKTEFTRAFINSLSDKELLVSSPTYNIVQIYEVGGKKIYHFDLYRLENEDELYEIGFSEALEEGLCLIEWPEIAKNYLPAELVNINIEIVDEEKRKITID